MAKIVWSNLDLEKLKKVYDLSATEVDLVKSGSFKEGLTNLKLNVDANKVKQLLSTLSSINPLIIFETKDGWSQLRVNEITYLESFKDEIDIHLESKQRVSIKEPLYQLEQDLLPYHFVRVGKSFIVNLAKVVSIKTGFNAKLDLILTSGEVVEVSRSYVKSFKQSLNL